MRLSRLLITAGLAATVILSGAATANAADVNADFAAQARSAGLATSQINTLQAKADEYLAEFGGRQVALNQIELDGATIRIALPGEAQPRKLSPALLDPHCDGGGADYRHFCAYRQTGFRGDHIDMYDCRSYRITWSGPGSWDNNQTMGTRARMYNSSGNLIFTTRPARSTDPNGNWTPVWSVRNC